MADGKNTFDEYFTADFRSRVLARDIAAATSAHDDTSKPPVQVVHPMLRPVSAAQLQPPVYTTNEKLTENIVQPVAISISTATYSGETTVRSHYVNTVTREADTSAVPPANQMTESHDNNHYGKLESDTSCLQHPQHANSDIRDSIIQTNTSMENPYNLSNEDACASSLAVSEAETTCIPMNVDIVCSKPDIGGLTVEPLFFNDVDYRIQPHLPTEDERPIAAVITAVRPQTNDDNDDTRSPRTSCLIVLTFCDLTEIDPVANATCNPPVVVIPIGREKGEDLPIDEFAAFSNDVDMRTQPALEVTLNKLEDQPSEPEASEESEAARTIDTDVCTGESKRSNITAQHKECDQKDDAANCASEDEACYSNDVDLRLLPYTTHPTHTSNVTDSIDIHSKWSPVHSISDGTDGVDLHVIAISDFSDTNIVPGVQSEGHHDHKSVDISHVDVLLIEQQIRRIREEVDTWTRPMTANQYKRRAEDHADDTDDNQELIKRLRSNFYTAEEDDEDHGDADEDVIDMSERNVIVSNTAHARDLKSIHVTFSSFREDLSS